MFNITVALSSLLLFANPIEKIDIGKIKIPAVSLEIMNQEYYLDTKIFIKDIIEKNNEFIVVIDTLPLHNEIVLSGMQNIYIEKNKEYVEKTKIGKDLTLDSFTKFILIPYNKEESYNQFLNNKVTFYTDLGTKIYAMLGGTVFAISYDINKGNYIATKIESDELLIEYWNLSSLNVTKGNIFELNRNIGYVGMTGLTKENQLTISVNDFYNLFSYKVIYLKTNMENK